jgi:hypothetical protein
VRSLLPWVFIFPIFIFSCRDQMSITQHLPNDDMNNFADAPRQKPSGEAQTMPSFKKYSAKTMTLMGQIPVAEESRYWKMSEKEGVVTLTGKKIIIQAGHLTRLFERLHQRKNITSLNIYAEEIDIYSRLKLPGTNLSIYARKLSLGKDSQIDVSAPVYPSSPRPFQDGHQGLSGGDIRLEVETFNIFNEGVYFIANGGQGQHGGIGANGSDGVSLPDLGAGVVYQEIANQRCSDTSRPSCRWVVGKKNGIAQCPGAGQNARAGGMPGAGGKPGKIISNLSQDLLQKIFVANSGGPGDSAGTYLGGRAGNPREAVFQRVQTNDSNTIVFRCPISNNGTDVVSPLRNVENILPDIISDPMLNPFTTLKKSQMPNYIRLYADDLYRLGHVHLAKQEYLKLTDENLQQEGAIHKILQIDSGVDYYGNAPAWIPGVAYEVIESLYQSEIKNAFRLLYLALWLEKDQSSKEAKIATIHHLHEQFELRGLEIKNEIRNNQHVINEIERKNVTLAASNKLYQQHLEQLRSEIETEAQRRIHSQQKSAQLKRALLGLAALSKAIPAGAPVTVGVAQGIEALIAMSNSQDIGHRLLQLPSLVDAGANLSRWSEARLDWNARFQSFNYRDFVQMDSEQRTREIEKNRSFYAPILQTVKEQYELFKKCEMPADSVAREIQRIEETSPRFQQAVAALKVLNQQKQELYEMLQKYQYKNVEFDLELIEVMRQMNQLQKHLVENETGMDAQTLVMMMQVRASAKSRLNKYKYFLAKSFQYRLLRPFPGNLLLDGLEEQLNRIINYEHNPDPMGTAIGEALRSLYLDELSAINLSLFESLDRGELAEDETEIFIEFSQSELQALASGKPVYLNMIDRNIVASHQQNARLISAEIMIKPDDVKIEHHQAWSHAIVDFTMSHPGDFYVDNENSRNYFSRPDLRETGFYRWGTRVDLVANSAHAFQSAPGVWRLFSDISSGIDMDNLGPLYARPGMLTEFKVEMKTNASTALNVNLQSLMIKFRYSFRHQ